MKSLKSCTLLLPYVFLAFVFLASDCPGQSEKDVIGTPVFLKHLFLQPAGKFVSETFDLGEVGLGEQIPVLLQIVNRSNSRFEIRPGNSVSSAGRMLNVPTQVEDGENGIVEFMVNIPKTPKGMKETLGVNAILGVETMFVANFNFRYRDAAIFPKTLVGFSIDTPSNSEPDRPVEVSIPIQVSSVDLLGTLTLEADGELKNVSFSFSKTAKDASVVAKFSSKLVALRKVSGKLRIKSGDKILSETNLVFKRKTSVELYPDHLVLKFDADAKEFRGELIAKALSDDIPIEHVRIEAEHESDIPIEISVGKMSHSTCRVYVRVEKAEFPKDDELVLFSLKTPLKNENFVLPILVIRGGNNEIPR